MVARSTTPTQNVPGNECAYHSIHATTISISTRQIFASISLILHNSLSAQYKETLTVQFRTCRVPNMHCYIMQCVFHTSAHRKSHKTHTHTQTHTTYQNTACHMALPKKKNLIHFICANSPMMVVWLLLTLHLVPKCLWTTKFVWMIWTIVGSVYFFLSDVFKYFGEYLSFQWHTLQSMNVNCYKLFSFYRTANGEMQLAGDGTVNQPNVLVYSRLLHRTHDMLLNYRIEFHEVAMCETCWVYTGYEYVEQQTIFGKVSRNI